MQSKDALSPHDLHLWVTKATELTKDKERTIENLLSLSELKRLKSTGNANKRHEFLASRALMRHALSQHFSQLENEWIFIEQADSPPQIQNLPNNIYLSLSHSNNLICFVISSCPVGIDIESTDKKRDYQTLIGNMMNEAEVKRFGQGSPIEADQFYRFWCAKEAFFKALPLCEQSSTGLNNLPVLDLFEGKENWRLIEGKIEGFRLAVVVSKVPDKINCNYFRLSDNPAEIMCLPSEFKHEINTFTNPNERIQ